jgi:hypothetical protein
MDFPALDLDFDIPAFVGVVVPSLDLPRYSTPASLDDVIAKVERLLAFAQEVLARIQGTFEDALNGTGSLAMLLADLELVDDVKAMTRELKRTPCRLLPTLPQER